MNWIITENNKKINAFDIPTISIEEIKADVEKMKMRVVGFFGKQEFNNVRLYVVMADDKIGKLYVTSSLFTPDVKSYESFTQKFPAFHIFEREFYEEFTIQFCFLSRFYFHIYTGITVFEMNKICINSHFR